jgi:hypothetical protein
VLYSGVEAANLVGVGRNKFLKIAPPTRAYSVPANGSEMIFKLWPEPSLLYLRKQIAIGAVVVHPRSLTRPKAGVCIVQPRHVLAESQSNETAAFSKSHAWVDLVA